MLQQCYKELCSAGPGVCQHANWGGRECVFVSTAIHPCRCNWTNYAGDAVPHQSQLPTI